MNNVNRTEETMKINCAWIPILKNTTTNLLMDNDRGFKAMPTNREVDQSTVSALAEAAVSTLRSIVTVINSAG